MTANSKIHAGWLQANPKTSDTDKRTPQQPIVTGEEGTVMINRPIALVDDCRSPINDTMSATFVTLADDYSQPMLGKKDGYAWIPADIDIGPRKADRVRSISFLVLDVEAYAEAVKDDNGATLCDENGDNIKRVIGVDPPTVDDMMAELALRGFRCFLHTTYSHGGQLLPEGVEHPRYRLIFDLSRPLAPGELKIFGLYVADVLGLSDCFDSKCLDPARLFYTPRCPTEGRRKLYRHAESKGKPLDVDALLAEAQQIEEAIKSSKEKRHPSTPISVIDAFNAQNEIGTILVEHGYIQIGRRWLWAGSTTGLPGVRLLPDDGRVYSSHGGDPLNDGHAHDAFDCHRILRHDGDMTQAVKDAAQSMGMALTTTAQANPGKANTPAGTSGSPESFIKEAPPTPWPTDCMPPGMARAVDAIAEHVQAPKALAGMAVLGAVAHIAMRLVDARHPKKEALPASLYILTALESGGRKSECFNIATDPIAKLERKAREAHKAQATLAKLNTLASNTQSPPDPRTIFTDTTTQKIEHEFVNNSAPALSLSTDEGGTLLGGHSLKSETRAASLGTLTKLFDGAGVQRDRIGEGQSGFRYGVRFGLYLSAQPIVLIDALSDQLLRGQGFLPRFLYTAPASLAGTRLHDEISLTRKTADDQRIIDYWHSLTSMCSLTVKVDEHGSLILPTAEMDPEAVKIWLAFYNETERQQGVGGDFEMLAAFASRAGELAARVAAVYAAWRCCENGTEMSDARVTGDDMQLAVALVWFSLAEWRRHAEGTALTPIERDARDLLDLLHRKGWRTTTRGKIGQHCQQALRNDTPRRKAAILELQRRCWLIESDEGFDVIQKTGAPPAVAVSAVTAVSDDEGLLNQTAETAETATARCSAGISESDTANLPNDFVSIEA